MLGCCDSFLSEKKWYEMFIWKDCSWYHFIHMYLYVFFDDRLSGGLSETNFTSKLVFSSHKLLEVCWFSFEDERVQWSNHDKSGLSVHGNFHWLKMLEWISSLHGHSIDILICIRVPILNRFVILYGFCMDISTWIIICVRVLDLGCWVYIRF